MKRLRTVSFKLLTFVAVFILSLAAFESGLMPLAHVDAAYLTTRSLYVVDQSPGATTEYRISFNYPGGNNVGSLLLEFCDDSLVVVACVSPPGMDVSAALLSSQTGVTGYSIFSQTTNKIILTRSSSLVGFTPSTYTFTGVVNPNQILEFYYIRMSTYASTDATGPVQDAGGVASSIPEKINISTEVPPLLHFCVGIEITGNCDASSGEFINLGLLSSSETRFAKSEMVVASNARSGFAISLYGATMTAGNKIISRMETPAASQIGVAQFGTNLADNTTPDVGALPAGPGTGVINTDYDDADQFLFESGDTLITSNTTTNYTEYTNSYIVNIPPDQPYGVYNTTLTYICTGTF